MYQKNLAIILLVIICFSCKNSGNTGNANKDKDSIAINSVQKDTLPDISGVYRLPETGCDIVITIMKEKNGFKYYIKGMHLDVEGMAVLSADQVAYYVTFDGPTGGDNKPNTVSGEYKDNTITIQNYGNSMNEYHHFKDCDEKFLEFKKN